MTKYKFDCGCEVDLINESIKDYDQLPHLNIPYDDMITRLNYERGCPKVWEMLGEGHAKGVFQLESNLGQGWAKKVKPTSLEEMSALISLIRPGVLKALLGDKSMAMHYVDRKAGIDEVTYISEELREFLEATYGVLLYQEQTLNIVKGLAGFSESDADILRRGLGKKKADVVAQCKKDMIIGFANEGKLSKDEAEQVADWIEKGNRYLFNKSHGISYGGIGYLTAWVKVHFPLHFYCSWIKYARKKQKSKQEVKELVKDAKVANVEILTPTVESLFENESDVCINVDNVTFGIRSVKDMGDAAVNKFIKSIHQIEEELGKTISDFTWLDFLICLSHLVGKKPVINLISVGMFDYFGLTRQRMLYEYDICRGLTKVQRKLLKPLILSHDNIVDLLTEFKELPKDQGGPPSVTTKKKMEELIFSLANPSYDIDSDDPSWVIRQENELLGTSLTYSAIETVDSPLVPNTTCKEFEDGKDEKNMVIAGEIISARSYMCKTGEMGFATLEDQTGTTDLVIFVNEWEKYAPLFFEGSLLACLGNRSDRGSFCVNRIFEI